MGMINNFLALTLQLSVPIILGALCGTIAERGGVVMLGVEGMMLIGSFAGAVGSYFTGSALAGAVISVVLGAVMGWIYGLFCLKWKAQQSVVGVGVNLFASGITAVMLKAIWNTEGMSGSVPSISNITVPGLCKVPVLGAFFSEQSPYLYLTLLITLGVWVVFYKTKYGLRYRAIGDQPFAVQTAGVARKPLPLCGNDDSRRHCRTGGSYLSISQNNLFVIDMVAGRGFMGLAANIFGGWQPLGSLGAGMVFAVAQAARFYLTGQAIPSQFVQMLPYVVTLVVLVVVGKRVKGPEALGKLVD